MFMAYLCLCLLYLYYYMMCIYLTEATSSFIWSVPLRVGGELSSVLTSCNRYVSYLFVS